MPRINRAAQFAPFNALKGLNDALRMKEYEHEKILKGDLSQEQVEKISETLLLLKNNDIVFLTYFSDGYYKTIEGKCKIKIEEQLIIFDNLTINFDDIYDISKK